MGFIVALVSVTAVAGHAADDLVTVRQGDMKAMAFAAKTIADMFKDPPTYSSTGFKRAADTIADKSGNALIVHFAGETATANSKAKPNIGEERDRFDRLATDLKNYANALAAAAERNPGTMGANMRMKPGEPMGDGPFGTHVRTEAELSSMPAEHIFHLMLQTCTSCHARFRTD
ncbi:cytochrome c [Rhizobium sp. RCC_161_2]|uniref:cytochrome c n=1 Tax=Rhizobium sp. RCC_161_2 TaxID=3239219 RepID=UPI003524D9C3